MKVKTVVSDSHTKINRLSKQVKMRCFFSLLFFPYFSPHHSLFVVLREPIVLYFVYFFRGKKKKNSQTKAERRGRTSYERNALGEGNNHTWRRQGQSKQY